MKKISKARREANLKAKRERERARGQLLRTLRKQSEAIGFGRFTSKCAPELYALALAAQASGRSSFSFCGTRFAIRSGWWLNVIDPATGATLVATSGGVL